jgi:hypothetical protein
VSNPCAKLEGAEWAQPIARSGRVRCLVKSDTVWRSIEAYLVFCPGYLGV